MKEAKFLELKNAFLTGLPLIDYLTALASNQDWTEYCEDTEQIEQTNDSIDEILDQEDYVYEDEIEDDLIRFDEPE